MSKKPQLSDVPGIGAKMEEKLRQAGFKTVAALSKAASDKLAKKVDGLSEAGAAKLIKAAQELAPPPKAKEEKPKKAPTKKEKPVKKAEKAAPKKAKEEPTVKKVKAKAKEEKPKKTVAKKVETPTRGTLVEPRLLRIANAMRKRQPRFRHEQAHRWVRVSDSWRKLRGIDNATREKTKGRIAMVSTGYRKPKAARGIHPSGYVEVLVHKPSDLEGLDPDLYAIRIGATIGLRKRTEILTVAETMLLKVLNPGAPDVVEEEELFADLEGIDDLEVD